MKKNSHNEIISCFVTNEIDEKKRTTNTNYD